MSESVGEQKETVYYGLRPWGDLALELLCEKWPGSLGAESPRELPMCEMSVVGEKEEEEKLSLHV